MSELYEAAAEIREPVAGLRDACERIADALETMLSAAGSADRLERLETILLDLFPVSCERLGLARPAAEKGGEAQPL